MDNNSVAFIFLNIIGFSASFLSITKQLPQIVKLIFYKECNDLSIHSSLMAVTYGIIFFICGVFIGDLPLMLTNIIIAFFSIVTIVFIRIYTKRKIFNERHHWEQECISLLLKLETKEDITFQNLVEQESLTYEE
ncbi:PQ-loop domain-containing transporter [Spiroplasma endosymbiont of Aspidapion aeneum]|uniref:SemiSWEET family sugar transporter n=1 Tax=Spiroplasma endosymbiont of Aspidapion aeneum TaxID=3066276 RepID=UPI00313BE2E9